MQAKRLMRHSASYPWSGAVGKIGAERSLQGLLSEPLRGQESSRLGPSTAPPEELSRRVGLRLEPADGFGLELAGDALALEIRGDRRVPVAALGERCGTGAGEPAVVDHPGPAERAHRLAAHGRRDVRPPETLGKRLRG